MDIFIENKPTFWRFIGVHLGQRLLPLIMPLTIFLVALLPRLVGLDVFLTADEDDQIMFASLFLKSALKADLSNALVLGYPGIPTLVLGAIGVGARYLFHYSGLIPLPWVSADLMTTLEKTTLQFGVFEHPLDFIVWVRVPMALLAAMSVLGIYLLLRRLLDETLALFATLIIAFDPFILAHTRVIHVDAPLAYFMFLSFLAFILYLTQGGGKLLFTAGLFAGLAALSKTGPAVFLGPILVVSGLCYALFYQLNQPRKLYWKRLVLAVTGCGLIGGGFFCLLWPAMWKQPFQTVSWIIRNLASVNRIAHPTTGVFWGGRLSDQNPFYYLIVLPYHLTPLTTIGLLAALGLMVAGVVAYFYARTPTSIPPESGGTKGGAFHMLPLTLSLIAYVTLFVGPVSLVSRRGDRYILPVYFALDLLALLGLWWMATYLSSLHFFKKMSFYSTPRLLGGLIFLQILFILPIHPYYLAYFNPLLGGGKTAAYYLNVGWGEGLDQAALYLNNHTDKQTHQTAAWYSNQFAPFYKSATVDLSDQNSALFSEYVVFYINQVQRGFPSREILDYFHQRQPDYIVKLGNIKYAWIYKGAVVSSTPFKGYAFSAEALFGGGAHLMGLDVAQRTMPADMFTVSQTVIDQANSSPPIFSEELPGLPITLYWETVNRISGKQNVYISLVDNDGNSWGKVDRLILAGLWRPNRWRPGFFIRDEYRLLIDPATPPGTYHFEVGMYDFVTGQTLGVAKNIGEITLTPPKNPPSTDQLNVKNKIFVPINDSLNLVGHTYQNVQLPPGAELTGKIFWQTTSPISKNYAVQFWFPTSNSQKKLIIHESPLSDSYPNSQWRPGEVVGEAYRFRISGHAPAGNYPMMVSVIDADTGESAGLDITLAQVTVQQIERNYSLPKDVVPVSATLNNEIELVGYKLLTETVAPDGTFSLTLYWHSLDMAKANYTVFVHAIGPDQLMRGQWDSMPVQGSAPTSGWLPNQIIEDPYKVLMVKDAPPWKYDIFVGMYDSATGQRLPLTSQSSPISDNRVWLTRVQVVDK